MKVLLIQRVVPHYRIDLFNSIYELLSKRNIDFTIFCGFSILDTKYVNTTKRPVYLNISLKNIRLFQKHITFYYNLFFILKAEKPDLIITEGGSNTINNIIVLFYNKLYKVPFVVWDLGKFVKLRDSKSSLIEAIYSFIYKKTIIKSNSIITYNKAGAKYFKESFNLETEKIQILHNTINEKNIFKSKNSVIVDKEFEKFAANFSHIIIFVGAIDKFKNLDFIIRIQNKLNDDFGFLIIGNGTYKIEFQNKMKKFNTFFTGQVNNLEQLAYYYGKSKVFLLPGLGGLSINQSLAYGVPVICSESDGSEFDLIVDGETGFILEKNNLLLWESRIKFICNLDKSHFETKCVRHIMQNFTLESAASNFIKSVVTNISIS